MKKLIVLLLLMLTSVLYGQNDVPLDSLSVSEAERIVDKYAGKISDTFETGLSKIAPVA